MHVYQISIYVKYNILTETFPTKTFIDIPTGQNCAFLLGLKIFVSLQSESK